MLTSQRPWAGTVATAEGEVSREATNSRSNHDIKVETNRSSGSIGQHDNSNQLTTNQDSLQPPSQILESIGWHFTNDKPLKLETFRKLSDSLRQHSKTELENGGDASSSKVVAPDGSVLMSLVHNVVTGLNTEPVEQEHQNSNFSGKDPELIILSGKILFVTFR